MGGYLQVKTKRWTNMLDIVSHIFRAAAPCGSVALYLGQEGIGSVTISAATKLFAGAS